MIAPRAAASAVDALRAYLDPAEAAARLRRAVPLLRDGAAELASFVAERWEVRDDDRVVLAGTAGLERGSGAVAWPIFVAGGVARRRPTVPGAYSRLVGEDPAGGAVAWLSPADPKLVPPALLDGPDAPGIRASRLLGHRFGRRMTVRREAGPGVPARVEKRWAKDVAPRMAERHRALADAGLPFRVPRPLGPGAAPGSLAIELLPGRSLHERLLAGEPVPAASVGAALRALRRAPVDGLAAWTLEDELAVIARLADRVGRLDVPLAAALRGRVAAFPRTPYGAVAAADVPLVPTHRDLHDKQVLVAGDRLGILDWDLAARAPAALDPANLAAHVTLRRLQGSVAAAAAARVRAALLDAVGPDDPADPTAPSCDALRAWESLAFLRLAGVYALRPGSTDLPRRLLAAADRPEEIR